MSRGPILGRRELLLALGGPLVLPPALAAGAEAAIEPYGGRWWGCMEVFDNAANINTKSKSALAWTCRRSGKLTGQLSLTGGPQPMELPQTFEYSHRIESVR